MKPKRRYDFQISGANLDCFMIDFKEFNYQSSHE